MSWNFPKDLKYIINHISTGDMGKVKFLKLQKVLIIYAKFPVFGILPSEVK